VRRTPLFWKLYLTYLLAVVLCAGVVGWLAVGVASDLYHQQAVSDLTSRAELASSRVTPLLGDPTRLESVVRSLGASSDTRLTVIAGPEASVGTEGRVLADSEADPATMVNHDTPSRPEVLAALNGGIGEVSRFSETLKRRMLYVAIPVFDAHHQVEAVIRTALPLTQVDAKIAAMRGRIALGALIAALAVALLGLLVSRSISGRMRAIRRGAERFAAGDFAHEILVTDSDEIGEVALGLNAMGRQLSETIQTITGERNEREAVLAGMSEGVLAVDGEERVITINAAAAGLLGVEPEQAHGRSIQEVVRNPDLQAFVAAVLSGEGPFEGELVVHAEHDPRELRVHGAQLDDDGDGDHADSGAVVVLNDVTRMRHYEAIRRDFVANVSHEIKTPVTTIKGFAETLLDGALDDRDDAERFLRIIVGQADRLSAIIGDLLSLSSLESDAEDAAIALERGSIRDVLQVALDVCEMKAGARQVKLTLDCPEELYAEINPPLLEQAVVNLIDNAVKYSPEGGVVSVAAGVEAAGLSIKVKDAGRGIPREHLTRLFERFYRVDKARSRDMGGTGLGLSIVKHIAVAHGGWVAVESTPGLGSTFTITIPA
jgi:two-component system, OmpR family, phosphate regulon sensor histidine kinase PhoR